MTKYIPRPYQVAAHDAAIKAIDSGETPYLSLYAGSGKSLVAAMLSMTYISRGYRVIQIVPSSEIVNQNRDAIENPDLVGRCCSKLGYTCLTRPITIGTPVSLLDMLHALQDHRPTLCIIDECHLVSPSSAASIRKIIMALDPQAIIGLSSTPYRQGRETPKGTLFTSCTYETDVPGTSLSSPRPQVGNLHD